MWSEHDEKDIKVIVIGASGFLGAKIVATLQQRPGVTVQPVSRRPGQNWTQVDDYSATPDGDVLVHLAEDSDRRRANEAGEGYATGIRRTLEALLAKKYRRVVYASSAVLYGDESMLPHGVTDPIKVSDIYTRIKSESEMMVLGRAGGVVVRLANLYGPGMSESNVLSAILAQIPGEGDVRLWDTSPVRDFLWIDDAAEAMAVIALGDAEGIYNLGSGHGYSVGDIANSALALTNETRRGILATHPSSRSSHLMLDIDETKRVFDWEPKTSLKVGLEHLITRKLTSS